jgi:nucleoid DNA-binding protein
MNEDDSIRDQKVTLVGLGSFERRARNARDARNPKALFKKKVSPEK